MPKWYIDMVDRYVYLLLFLVVISGCTKLPQENELIGRYRAQNRPEVLELKKNGEYSYFQSADVEPTLTDEFEIDLSDSTQPCVTFSKLNITKNDKGEIVIQSGKAFVPFYISSESHRWTLTVYESDIKKLVFVKEN